jgi:hypothetical protein
MVISAGLADSNLKGQLTDLGSTPLSGSLADFGKLIVEETEKWARVIRAANIKPEARADRYSSTPSVVQLLGGRSGE